jgi:hypothetical protein
VYIYHVADTHSPLFFCSTNMSLRHMPRQPERAHDSSLSHAHPLVSHPPPHVNGTSTIPTTPGGLSNGSSHPNSIISPTALPTTVASNGVTAPSSALHRLAVANEQTWLLIGELIPPLTLSFPGIRVANGLILFSQVVWQNRWEIWNMHYRHMKMPYGTTRCPCLASRKSQVSLGSKRITQK